MSLNVPHKMAENLEFVKKAFAFSNETVQVVKDSFGPKGLDTLISTSSGTLLLTNDGFPMLKSLSSGSPVGRLIFQGLDLFYKSTGDFSKKFILLIRELLCVVLDVVSVDKTTASEQILCILQGMDCLLCESLSKLFDKLQAMGVVCECSTGEINDVKKCVISILRTSINGKFSPKTSDFLVSLLCELIFLVSDKVSHDIACLRQTIGKLLDSFSEIVWEVPGKQLASSTVLPGIVIPREFFTMVKELPCLSETNSFKFVILGGSLGYDLPQSNTVLSLNDTHQVNGVLEWRRHYIGNIVKTLAEYNIELIITSTALHQTFVHICNQYNIAAIHLIPQEDITRISGVFGIHLLFELDNDLTSFIGVAALCKPIQVGQHVYTYLEPCTKTTTKQVLLYAPTEALCHQYSTALQNMLKTLQSSFKEQPEKSYVLSYVSGGGAFELGLAFMLEEYRKEKTVNANIKLASEILEKALLSIPRQLAKSSDCRLSIFHLKAKTKQVLTAGEQMFGINRNGSLSVPGSEGILEATAANFSLVSSVLQLFIQILRTDKVLHVQTLLRKNSSHDSDDSDNQ